MPSGVPESRPNGYGADIPPTSTTSPGPAAYTDEWRALYKVYKAQNESANAIIKAESGIGTGDRTKKGIRVSLAWRCGQRSRSLWQMFVCT